MTILLSCCLTAVTTAQVSVPAIAEKSTIDEQDPGQGKFIFGEKEYTLEHIVAYRYKLRGYDHFHVLFTRQPVPQDLLEKDLLKSVKSGREWRIPGSYKLMRALNPSIKLHFRDEKVEKKTREGKILSSSVETLLHQIHIKSGDRSFSLGGPRPVPDWWVKSDDPPEITLEYEIKDGHIKGKVQRNPKASSKIKVIVETTFDLPLKVLEVGPDSP